MSEWRDVDLRCTNCGQPLQLRWGDRSSGLYINGCYPVEVRHFDGSVECPPLILKAEVYDVWRANRELVKAEGSLRNTTPEPDAGGEG